MLWAEVWEGYIRGEKIVHSTHRFSTLSRNRRVSECVFDIRYMYECMSWLYVRIRGDTYAMRIFHTDKRTPLHTHISLAGKLKAVYILLYVLVLTHTLMPVGFRIYVCVRVYLCIYLWVWHTHFHTNIGHILRVYRVNWMVVGGRSLDGWIVGRRGGRMAKRVQSLATVWMLAKLFPRWKGCICTQILNTVTVILRRLMGSWKLHFVKKASFGTDVSEGH